MTRLAHFSRLACSFLVLLAIACTTDRTRRGYLLENAAHRDPPQRPAIVVPGFGVTRLYDPLTEQYVWGTPRATMRTRFDDDLDLPLDAARDRLVPRGYVGSRGPVNVGWQLTEALRKYGGYVPGETVHSFFYDWRLSALDNAASLAAFIAERRNGGKVDVITHSAGALVALAYVKLLGGGDHVDRLIMIAPPQQGVIDAFRIFVRPERFIRRTFTAKMVATWPSVYELFPSDGEIAVRPDGDNAGLDLWRPETWRSIGAEGLPVPELVSSAQAFRADLERAPIPHGVTVTVIAGDCVPTARRVLYRGDGSFAFYPGELRAEEHNLFDVLFEDGDGTVPAASARGRGDAILFCDGHQGLATDPNVHRALLRQLR